MKYLIGSIILLTTIYGLRRYLYNPKQLESNQDFLVKEEEEHHIEHHIPTSSEFLDSVIFNDLIQTPSYDTTIVI